MVIYSSQCTDVQSLMFVRQRVFKILSVQNIQMSSLTLDLRHFDTKINVVHLLSRMYDCMKFEICQAKGSQDIERTNTSYFQC
jgi:acetolactate synthase regulatory subunit